MTLYRGVGTFDTTPILARPWCEIPSSPTGRIIQTVCPDVLMNLIPLLIVHGLADTASHAWCGSLTPWLGSMYFTLSGLPVKDSHIRLQCNPPRPLPCHTPVLLSPSALAVLVHPCLSLSCTYNPCPSKKPPRAGLDAFPPLPAVSAGIYPSRPGHPPVILIPRPGEQASMGSTGIVVGILTAEVQPA